VQPVHGPEVGPDGKPMMPPAPRRRTPVDWLLE
jgi:hypothetical protein